MSSEDAVVQGLKKHLRDSVSLLSSMKLYEGAKWSAEALTSMSQEDSDMISIDHIPKYKLQVSKSEQDVFALAKTYFDCKEFDRCAHVLKNCKSQDVLFIRLYAMFLSGEKKKEEESEGVLGLHDHSSVNTSVSLILKELESILEQEPNGLKSPFLNWLHGVVLVKHKSMAAAKDAFIRSLIQYPYNWSCWAELLFCLPTFDEGMDVLSSLELQFQDNFAELIMLKFAKVVINQQCFQQTAELKTMLDSLIVKFPKFSFLKTQHALICYHALKYNIAEELFDEILVNDPLRLDEMDIYSNILYVMDKRSKLAFLAQFACAIDKFRPETCCIVANYYSMKFEHEKAIMYYRRALTLNRNSLSAWTLMGHEFVELKNTHAAIESYRRAVDTNYKDFKAWYGLGQAYEILDMHLYSLYYYQKAASLNPLDQRVWEALGNCYEKLDKIRDSITCYQKAINLNEVKNVSHLYKLALLYEKLQDPAKTYDYMFQCYQEEINEGVRNDETAKARLWLAKYETRNQNWEAAHKYAVDLTHGTGQEIEEARAVARETRNRINLQ